MSASGRPDLRVTLVQHDLLWENPRGNRETFSALLTKEAAETDLVLLPEMFTTGFTLSAAEVAESMDGVTVSWMSTLADTLQAAIGGSLIIKERGNYYNRFVLAEPGGAISFYDKKYLFSFAREDEVMSPGDKKVVIELKGWRICPFVCYDLRFPVWSANLGPIYDVAVYVANWPGIRSTNWRTLLRARAIENLAYVAGVNRVGVDGYGLSYGGDSTLINPMGEIDHRCGERCEVVTLTLSREVLDDYREKFPALQDMLK